MNLLDGTKDFSGDWINSEHWVTDGTYKGLTVKKETLKWAGIYKALTVPKGTIFTAPEDGVYSFSAYVKAQDTANVFRFVFVNGVNTLLPNKELGKTFDWTRDSLKITLKAGDTVYVKYDKDQEGDLWTAGHKWEEGSIATPYMPSFSEVTVEDYPSYIGTYTDNNSNEQSTDPEKYSWKKIE